MKIGIDIDDTIANSFETVFADSQKFDIEVVGNNGALRNMGKAQDHHYMETIYNWSEQQAEQFWITYLMKYITKSQPKEDAPSVIQKLKEQGHKIYIITSRYENEIYPNVINPTKEWFTKNKIPYDELVINVQEKAKACKEHDIDLFIDDSITHCRNIQKEGIKTLVYTTSMNQAIEVEKEGLTRAYSWTQIYYIIQKMLQKNI